MPGGYVCSGTLKRSVVEPGREEAGGRRIVKALLSKPQRAFLAEHAPAGLELDDLSVLGPILVLKLKFEPEGFERRLVAELWLYPDGSRVLELSTKCAQAEAFQEPPPRAFLPAARHGPRRRAGDEDREGARVLRGEIRWGRRRAAAGGGC